MTTLRHRVDPAAVPQEHIRVPAGRGVVFLTKEHVAEKLGLDAEGIDDLVRREVMIPPDNAGLWTEPRIEAWHAGIIRAQGREGVVYAVGFANYVKIGFTIRGLAWRLRSLQPGVPEPLEVYGSFKGTHFDEIFLLGKFIEYRTIGEWHRHEGALAEWIAEGCPP